MSCDVCVLVHFQLYQIADASKGQTDLHPANDLPARMFKENPALSRFIVQCRVFYSDNGFLSAKDDPRDAICLRMRYEISCSQFFFLQESIPRKALTIVRI